MNFFSLVALIHDTNNRCRLYKRSEMARLLNSNSKSRLYCFLFAIIPCNNLKKNEWMNRIFSTVYYGLNMPTVALDFSTSCWFTPSSWICNPKFGKYPFSIVFLLYLTLNKCRTYWSQPFVKYEKNTSEYLSKFDL